MNKKNLSINESKIFLDNLEEIIETNDKELFLEQMEKIGTIENLKYGDYCRKPYISISSALKDESIDFDSTIFYLEKILEYGADKNDISKFVSNYYSSLHNKNIKKNAKKQINFIKKLKKLGITKDSFSYALFKHIDWTFGDEKWDYYYIQFLLENGADPNFKIDKYGIGDYESITSLVIEEKDLKLLKIIYENGAKLTEEILKYFSISELKSINININIDPNKIGSNGETGLTNVLLGNPSLESVKELVKKGADLNKPNKEGYYPIEFLLLAREEKNEQSDFSDILEYFIEKKVDINVIDDEETAPLGMALKQKLISLQECETKKEKRFINDLYDKYISILLNAGSDVNAKENHEELSWYSDSFSGVNLKNTIKLLLENGLKPETALFIGMTPAELKKLGIKDDFNINELNDEGETLFTHNINYSSDKSLSFFKALKKYKPNFNLKNTDGDTPLNVAIGSGYCMQGNIEIIEYLLNNKADPNISDSKENTPLIKVINSKAKLSEKRKIIKLMLEKGATPELSGKYFNSALQASLMKCKSLLPLLRKNITTEPSSLSDILLYQGEDAFKKKCDSSKKVDDKQISLSFNYSLHLRENKITDYILNNFEKIVSKDYSRFRAIGSNGYKKIYDLNFLKYIVCFDSLLFLELWNEVIEHDKRKTAIDLAQNALSLILNKKESKALIQEAYEKKQKALDNAKTITAEFTSKIKQLFNNLIEKGIFAVNIDGSGWDPSDHGWEVADFMINDADWDKLGITKKDQALVCYTDLKYYKNEAKLMGSNGETQPVTNACIYYYGPTDSSKEKIAHQIVYESKEVGFSTGWDGDINKAVCVSI